MNKFCEYDNCSFLHKPDKIGDYNNNCKEHLLNLLKNKKTLTESKVNLYFSGDA